MVLALVCAQLLPRFREHVHIRWAGVVVLAGCFAAALSPWMYRNWQQFGVLQITDRAGAILILRAVKNDMTAVEYRGAFYVWAPRPLRPLVGAALGFDQRDLMRGGRLQRLNRHASDFHADDKAAKSRGRAEEAISLYYKTRADRNKLRRAFRAAGHPQPDIAADQALEQRAWELIRSQPLEHVAATLPFLWRGAFLPFPLLLCALWYGLRSRRYDLVLFALPAFGAVMFYALLTHFIQRYGLPAWPVALTSAVVLGQFATGSLRASISQRRNAPSLSDAVSG